MKEKNLVKKVRTNIPLLPIEFEFTLPGVSGFKIGDTFSITDLPRYNDKVFQVVEVSHSIEQSIWTTTVRGKLRNEKDQMLVVS